MKVKRVTKLMATELLEGHGFRIHPSGQLEILTKREAEKIVADVINEALARLAPSPKRKMH
jgi:hypothetical protein